MGQARPCPACAGSDATSWATVDAYPIVRCARCRTLYTVALPADATADYAAYYSEATLEPPAFVGASLDRIVAGFEPYRQTNRLLDVGFGAAAALCAAERAGWQVAGVEVSGQAVAHAKELGLDVFHGVAADAPYAPGSFDVVLLIEVLEHVADPASLLREVRPLIRTGGALWATTPHGRGLSARLLGGDWTVVAPPEHLQLFSTRGIRALLGATGFVPVTVTTKSINPLELVAWAKAKVRRQGPNPDFNRGEAAYRLVEASSRRPAVRAAKWTVNQALRGTGLGDSLRILARPDSGAST